MNECPPGPQVFHWGCFEFFENSQRYSRMSMTTAISCSAVSTTPAKNLILVKDFQRSLVSLLPSINLLPVTMTPVNNYCRWPVTRTRMPWRWGAAKDRWKLKGINQRYPRLLKSDTAADGVIEPPWKAASINTPHILIRGPWGCQN